MVPRRGLRLGRGDEDEPAALVGDRVVEGAGRVLEGSHQEVVEPLVVGERRGRERLAALPAADEVQEGVDAAEALGEGGRPLARRVLGEEVDDAGVDALVGQGEAGGQLVEALLVDVGEREAGAGLGEPGGHDGPRPPAAPAIATILPSSPVTVGTLLAGGARRQEPGEGDGGGAAEAAEEDVERGVGLVRRERGAEGAVAEVLAELPEDVTPNTAASARSAPAGPGDPASQVLGERPADQRAAAGGRAR